MKKIIFILILLVFINCVFASGIQRNFPTTLIPGEEATIELIVTIDGDDDFYILEEIVPQEIEVLNASNDAGIVDNSLRWVEFQGAKSETLSYTIIVPENGNYIFGGTYAIGGATTTSDELKISGETTLIVGAQNPPSAQPPKTNDSAPQDNTLLIVGIGIIIIIIVLYIVTTKPTKKSHPKISKSSKKKK